MSDVGIGVGVAGFGDIGSDLCCGMDAGLMK